MAKDLQPAVFLDRDGTINFDPGYLSRAEQLELLPQAGQAIALLSQAGFKIVVISNQSGVGRGIIPANALPQIHARLNELLHAHGTRIEHFYLCTHRPDERCECRKPGTLLVTQAQKDLGIDLSRSAMVGDKISDLEMARNAQLGASILVRTGTGTESENTMSPGLADHIATDLLDAAQWILKTLKV